MIKNEDFKRISIEELQSPEKGGLYKLYTNHWWATDSDGLALLYKGTRPQCNINKTIVDIVPRNAPYQKGKPVFLAKAFLSVAIKDLI